MQKKLIAVHVCAIYIGAVRKDIPPGDPIPDDIDPQALQDLIRLKAVKEEEISDRVLLVRELGLGINNGADAVEEQGKEASDVAVADVLAAPVTSTEPAVPPVQPDAGQLATADASLATEGSTSTDAADDAPADAPLDATAAPADEAAPAEPTKKSARQPKA
ncbi:MAG: hypothetical protein JSR83_09005 [Proteobacteria bacterium]|nr:hypothetical protein [Pseudomonadota bacterium]